MASQYDEEIVELETQEKEDELMFGDDTRWTKKAVAAINDAKQKLIGIGNPPDMPAQPVERITPREPIVFAASADAPDMHQLRQTAISPINSHTTATANAPQTALNLSAASFSSKVTAEQLPGAIGHLKVADSQDGKLAHGHSNSKASTAAGRSDSGSFFFYNALPNFYLSPLDIRILKAAFGPFSSFPSTILPRLEHISTGHIVDEDLRKRAKYLAHLPYGCEVSFLECDWTDVIAPAVLSPFSADIERRRKRHREKEAREERDKVRAEKEEEDKRYAAARRKRPSSVEKSCSEIDFLPLAQVDGAFGASPSNSYAMSTTPPWSGAKTHSSFATLGSPGTSPDAPRTVWGTAAILASSPPVVATVPDDTVPDDGWLQGWEKDLLDNDDAVAMVEASVNGEGSSKAAISSGKQRKKNKKITLMSTNARRGA